MASCCLHENSKKKISSTEVSPATTVNTTQNKVAKDGDTQKKESNIVKKDTLSSVADSKNSSTKNPVITDTLRSVKSGFFLLKDETEILKKEVNSLKTENKLILEDIKALKIELEALKKEKK